VADTVDSGPPALPDPPGQTLAAWRARGAHQVDPVQFHFLEALARRAAAHGGDTRRLLDQRLAQLLAAHGQRLAAQPPAGPAPRADQARQADQAPPSPLADLLRRLNAPRPGAADEAPAHAPPATAATTATAPAELKTLQQFRSTWSRLRVDQQLSGSLARVPENAGPLHSDRLLLLALQRMRALSPQYLERLLGHVDALLWLDQATGGSTPAPRNVVRAEGEKKRKPARPRAR